MLYCIGQVQQYVHTYVRIVQMWNTERSLTWDKSRLHDSKMNIEKEVLGFFSLCFFHILKQFCNSSSKLCTYVCENIVDYATHNIIIQPNNYCIILT